MGKYKKLLSNTAILGAGTFTSKVLVFLLMPLYTALLSTEQYGTADILTQTANLLIPLAALGIGDGLFRFALDADERRRRQIFTSAMAVITLGALPLAAIVQAFRLIDIYDGYIWLVFAYVCCANLHSVCANYIRACGKTGVFAIQGIANTALTILLNVLFLVVFDMGVLGYVLSVAVSDLTVTLVLILACRLYRHVELGRAEKGLLPDMLKFSIPYIPTTLMWMITSASDRFIVTAVCGTAENGLYAAAYKLPTLISLAGGVFIEAWHISSVSDATPEERSGFFGKVYKNYLGIMFIGTSVLVASSRLLTRMLLDDSYFTSWKYVPVLGMAMLFSAFASFMGSVYFLEKRSLRSTVTAAVGAAVNIVLNLTLIPSFGAMGAAVATVFSYVVVFAVRAYDTGKYLRFGLCIPRTLINCAILSAQTVIMVLDLRGWLLWQLLAFVALAVINGREIVAAVVTVVNKKVKK